MALLANACNQMTLLRFRYWIQECNKCTMPCAASVWLDPLFVQTTGGLRTSTQSPQSETL